MSYAHMTDGVIDQTASSLPPIFGNVTGFDLAGPEVQAEAGWLPLVDVRDTPAAGQVLGDVVYEVQASQVVARYAARDRTDAEVAALRDRLLSTVQLRKALALSAMDYVVADVTYRITLGVQDQMDVLITLQELGAAPAGTTTQWEVVNNVFLAWGVGDLAALQAAGVQHVQAVYANVQAHVAAIGAASASQLDGYDVMTGWP